MSCLIYVGLQQQDSNQISENSTNINHQKLVEHESVQALNERGPKAFANKNPVLNSAPTLDRRYCPMIIYQYKATNSNHLQSLLDYAMNNLLTPFMFQENKRCMFQEIPQQPLQSMRGTGNSSDAGHLVHMHLSCPNYLDSGR